MAKTKIKILRKGDRVLSISADRVAIERKNGEVEIIPISLEGNGFIRLCTDEMTVITYGDGAVEVEETDEENGDSISFTF